MFNHDFHASSAACLSVCGMDQVLDLHGDVVDPDLVVFFSGDQFVMAAEVIRSFQEVFPRYQRTYFETLPAGLLEQQIRTGDLLVGNLRIQIQPDVLACDEPQLRRLHTSDNWFEEIAPYLRNRLVLMVQKGNPRQIRTWDDLARDDVRVVMPDPQLDGIVRQVEQILQAIEGDGIMHKIMKHKIEKGTTVLTNLHHRLAPQRILKGQADVGPVWYPEAALQKQIGNDIDWVELPQGQDGLSAAMAGRFRDAPHAQAAGDFLLFLRSSEAQRIYAKHGYLPLSQSQMQA